MKIPFLEIALTPPSNPTLDWRGLDRGGKKKKRGKEGGCGSLRDRISADRGAGRSPHVPASSNGGGERDEGGEGGKKGERDRGKAIGSDSF